MSSIGAQQFDIMRGPAATLSPRLDIWEVPGLDGYGAQLLGAGNGKRELTTVSYQTNINNAAAFVLGCRLVVGTVVTVVDDWANNFFNQLVVEMDDTNCYQPCKWNGNANAVRVELNWKLLAT